MWERVDLSSHARGQWGHVTEGCGGRGGANAQKQTIFSGSETGGHQDNTQTRPDSWVNI